MKNMIRTDMTACRGVPLNLCALRQAFVSVFLLLKYNKSLNIPLIFSAVIDLVFSNDII